MWLTEAEWHSLLPSEPRVGQKVPMPPAVVRRLAHFHLLDNTRGEPAHWQAEEVRSATMTWTVEIASDAEVVMTMTGAALMSSDADSTKAKRGYDVALRGRLRYDRAKKALTRFDLLAVGDHWGQTTYTPGARPGRTPLGVAFELVKSATAGDLVPPQAAREIAAYFAGK